MCGQKRQNRHCLRRPSNRFPTGSHTDSRKPPANSLAWSNVLLVRSLYEIPSISHPPPYPKVYIGGKRNLYYLCNLQEAIVFTDTSWPFRLTCFLFHICSNLCTIPHTAQSRRPQTSLLHVTICNIVTILDICDIS